MSKNESNRKRVKEIDHKTWIWVCLSIIALVFVIIAIVNFSQNESYDSSYFHDGDGRIVLTMDRDSASLDDSIYEPNITHIVYYYEGDNITGVKAFYEYATEAEAKTAYAHLGLGSFADSKRLSGRFIVFNVKRAMYENVTVEFLKNDRELLKDIDALILDYDEGYINNYAELTFEESDTDTNGEAIDGEDEVMEPVEAPEPSEDFE